MEISNLHLISEVKKRRALWTKYAEYLELQWQEVANVTHLSVNDCKNRFRVLRNVYRAEIRSLQQMKTSKSHWPYFGAMEFLRASIDPNNLVPFPPQPFGINISEILVVENPAQYDLSYASAHDENDLSFLLIILQHIKYFSNEKKLKFRMEINRILMELKEH